MYRTNDFKEEKIKMNFWTKKKTDVCLALFTLIFPVVIGALWHMVNSINSTSPIIHGMYFSIILTSVAYIAYIIWHFAPKDS